MKTAKERIANQRTSGRVEADDRSDFDKFAVSDRLQYYERSKDSHTST